MNRPPLDPGSDHGLLSMPAVGPLPELTPLAAVAAHPEPVEARSEAATEAATGATAAGIASAVGETGAADASADWDGPEGWQPLPARARRVFLYSALLSIAVPLAIATPIFLRVARHADWRWLALAATWALGAAFAWWIAGKRHRYTFWRLDEHGFAVRRGRLWQWETRVPTSRVQHLDLKRGPLERSHGLASLVLHTAGTRLSAVSISGLDDADAERLRDHFSRQIERQDDDDHA
jgi:hypothetical protein